MAVFTLPSSSVVFKIIKDTFGAPKNTTRRAVMDKYHFVFVRDRVGRLADAQEFEHLQFSRKRFDPGMLDELLTEIEQQAKAGEVRAAIFRSAKDRERRPALRGVEQHRHGPADRIEAVAQPVAGLFGKQVAGRRIQIEILRYEIHRFRLNIIVFTGNRWYLPGIARDIFFHLGINQFVNLHPHRRRSGAHLHSPF